MIAFFISMFLALAPATAPQIDPVAADVAKTAGVDAWKDVKVLRFALITGPALEVQRKTEYVYDRTAQKVTVTEEGRTVTVSLGEEASNDDAKWALSRWRRDSFWLLLPLEIANPGTPVEHKDDVKSGGAEYHVLHVSYRREIANPVDEFELYINARSNQIAASIQVYPDGRRMRFEWGIFSEVQGCRFATEIEGPARRIHISDIKVER